MWWWSLNLGFKKRLSIKWGYQCFKRNTAQKMKFSIKNFFSKCDHICSFRHIWSHLLKKFLMEELIFFAVEAENLITQLFIIFKLLYMFIVNLYHKKNWNKSHLIKPLTFNLPTHCLSVFDYHFVGLAFKGLKCSYFVPVFLPVSTSLLL